MAPTHLETHLRGRSDDAVHRLYEAERADPGADLMPYVCELRRRGFAWSIFWNTYVKGPYV